MPKSIKPNSNFKYSKAITELQEITEYLESSDVDLDEAIEKFERGTKIAAEIESHLKKAENIIRTIKSEV